MVEGKYYYNVETWLVFLYSNKHTEKKEKNYSLGCEWAGVNEIQTENKKNFNEISKQFFDAEKVSACLMMH